MPIAPDKIALVTGAADGLGWATAQAFAAAGYRIVLADIRQDAAQQRANELGLSHQGLGYDVASEPDVLRLAETTGRTHGRLDAVVHNAGIATRIFRQPIRALRTSSEFCTSISPARFWCPARPTNYCARHMG